jgi:general secretion pathway protein G
MRRYWSDKALSQRGFTLIEIMVVVVILGILATLVVPRILERTADARIAKAKQDLSALEAALKMYKLDNYFYPATDQGLEALTSKPAGQPEPRQWRQGGYVERLPLDPWGNPYVYLQPGQHGDFDVYSLGADGVAGGDGESADVGNWQLR